MNKKKIVIIAVILLILAIVLYFIFKPSAAIEYKTELPKITEITEKVEASGTINPVTQTSVGTQVSGRVQEMLVDFNTIVKQGDLLAVIDPSIYESQVIQQQASADRVQSQFTNSKRNLDRYRKLYKEELVAKSELDDAETDFLSIQSQLVQAQAALDKAKIDLGYTKIISPVNGIIISREIELGQTVAASFQTPTLFLVAEDLTKMQIEVAISEADISKIKEAQAAEFTVDAYPNLTFKGTVSQVRNSPTTVQNVVTYTVVVEVDNKDLKLKPGMTANAAIITAYKENILTVPSQALRFVPPADANIKGSQPVSAEGKRSRTSYKNQGVWVQANDEIERIEVKTGITDGVKTEIETQTITDKTPIIIAVKTAAESKGNTMRGPRF